MFNFFCKSLQHPKINPGSAPEYVKHTLTLWQNVLAFLCKYMHEIDNRQLDRRFSGKKIKG